MDDSRSRQFFVQPADSVHRRYEALRAFFVEGCSVPDIAEQFGYATATVYSLVRDFRGHMRAEAIPPFSSNRIAADLRAAVPRPRHMPRNRPLLTHDA